MRLDVSAVDGRAFGHRTCRRQRLEQIDPEAFARPAVEAVVDRGRRAILHRAIAPAAPDLEDMDDAGDHPAIIHTAGTALVPWQKRFDNGPLFIRQPKQVPHRSLQVVDWKR